MNWKTFNRAMKDIPEKASGVYAIREPGILGSVLYVGESHSGRLRETLRRHFCRWKGPTAGPTYGRKMLVGWIKLKAQNAIQAQNDLIAELRPRDNTVGKPEWWEFWK